MRIQCISDTHSRHRHLTSKAMGDILGNNKYDLLIHAGDFSNLGQKGEVEDFFNWCREIAPRYKHGIVVIAGNHDKSFDSKYGEYHIDDESGVSPKVIPSWVSNLKDSLVKDNIYYLENDSIIIDGVKIWGSPISPWFGGDRWAFNKFRGADEIGRVWDNIPLDVDIVVTHTPISYKLDYIPDSNEYVGCECLRYRIKEIKPLLHISGHIHEGYGTDYDQDTTYINAATCNLRYEPVNKPIVLDFDKANREVNIHGIHTLD
jgi:Icc-related predicted phosphoesterase